MARTYFGGFTTHPSSADTRKYMMGDCGYFALALHDVLGFDLVAVGSGHFAARAPDGKVWDIRGGLTPEQAVDGLRADSAVGEPMTREALVNELDSGLYSDVLFTPSRLTRAKALVRTLWTEPLPTPRRPKP